MGWYGNGGGNGAGKKVVCGKGCRYKVVGNESHTRAPPGIQIGIALHARASVCVPWILRHLAS